MNPEPPPPSGFGHQCLACWQAVQRLLAVPAGQRDLRRLAVLMYRVERKMLCASLQALLEDHRKALLGRPA